MEEKKNDFVNRDSSVDDRREMMTSVFEYVCDRLENEEFLKQQLKLRYRRARDDNNVTRDILHILRAPELTAEELTRMSECFTAFLDKSEYRVNISPAKTERILASQGNRCAVCGREISPEKGVASYEVPWRYVGDELRNNRIIVCEDCAGKEPEPRRDVHGFIGKELTREDMENLVRIV